MGATVSNERGCALIIAVIAMLIMGVLSVSFALLADIESRVGVNYKHQAQAEGLAEAALEMARDAVRTAPTASGGFSNWLNGTTANHMLLSGVSLGPGALWAKIDNDCAAFVPGYPTALQESGACDNTTDTNQVAVLTAWAVVGSNETGRARVRAVVGVDSPWKHVCANAKPDNNGFCNEPGNRNGSPTVTPADPNDPNGPQAYTDLPRPLLGCSKIAPMLHTATPANCASYPGIYAYPYPTGAGAPRMVMMGEVPGVPGVPPKSCNDEPAGGSGNRYFGYFDCALTTFCDPALGHLCPGGVARKACLRPTDSRVIPAHPNYDPTHYVAASGAWPSSNCATDTGLVFAGDQAFGNDIGSQAKRFDIYVVNGTLTVQPNRTVYGTLVVEGNEINNPCSDKDLEIKGGVTLWAGPNTTPPTAGWGLDQYGYPLVALIYNPDLPPPTIQPTYAPQPTCADMGSAGTQIHGMVYSAGHLEFNPLSMEGSVVAFEIQTQGSATYTYNVTYGNASPPPGFPIDLSNPVAMIRKSFMVCVNYNDDSAATTSCN